MCLRTLNMLKKRLRNGNKKYCSLFYLQNTASNCWFILLEIYTFKTSNEVIGNDSYLLNLFKFEISLLQLKQSVSMFMDELELNLQY